MERILKKELKDNEWNKSNIDGRNLNIRLNEKKSNLHTVINNVLSVRFIKDEDVLSIHNLEDTNDYEYCESTHFIDLDQIKSLELI